VKRIIYLTTAILAIMLTSCATSNKNIAFQTSTIDALLAGVYDGDTSCRDLLKRGDFGIGTFDHLDGEMVVLDGTIYQIKSDGKVYIPNLSLKTPFATICKFNADNSINIKNGSSYDDIKTLIDKHTPNQNLFYAIKIKGDFNAIKTRSVPAQNKPYPPLKAVTSHQPEFPMQNISGTIVGFRCPAYVKGINVPGYHLHFICSDKTKGGHILSMDIKNAICEIDVLNNFFLSLPADAEAFSGTDLSKDRSKDLREVEQ
jgi:acetolactate decarboxylase